MEDVNNTQTPTNMIPHAESQSQLQMICSALPSRRPYWRAWSCQRRPNRRASSIWACPGYKPTMSYASRSDRDLFQSRQMVFTRFPSFPRCPSMWDPAPELDEGMKSGLLLLSALNTLIWSLRTSLQGWLDCHTFFFFLYPSFCPNKLHHLLLHQKMKKKENSLLCIQVLLSKRSTRWDLKPGRIELHSISFFQECDGSAKHRSGHSAGGVFHFATLKW